MMSRKPIAVWLTPNPVFHSFHSPLLRDLSQYGSVAHWEYLQSQDEGSCLQKAVTSVGDYLDTLSSPIHLIGHGLGGWLGLLYARQFPSRINSLTLLGVGSNPALDWQAYYYSLFKHLRCPKGIILEQMVYNLFGEQNRVMSHYLSEVLRRDLQSSPSPHSLFKEVSDQEGGIDIPLLVCGSEDDLIVPPTAIKSWKSYLKPQQDEVWLTDRGYHFFHYFYPQAVGEKIRQFWAEREKQNVPATELISQLPS